MTNQYNKGDLFLVKCINPLNDQANGDALSESQIKSILEQYEYLIGTILEVDETLSMGSRPAVRSTNNKTFYIDEIEPVFTI